MIEIIFVVCISWLFYVYIGYPLLVYTLGIMTNRMPQISQYEPSVTILIPAYNEVEHIAATIENKLELDYPREKMEIIVISDESDDGTDNIVNNYEQQGVTLIRQIPRQGKTSGLSELSSIPSTTAL